MQQTEATLTPKTESRIPELLAPAGNWECVKAAVCNGADAIYFGLPAFNARMRADNFTEEDLPDLIDYVHRHGVRAFVTMNTLIFSGELEAAAAQLEVIERAGVDAVIVQDLGLALMAKRLAPSVALHASTQMTITSPEALNFAEKRLGLDRAVLARELSLKEIRLFHANAETALPIEVFVHGALCVAYSGQCLTSEALGQRSANRGECAQACRMPYQLVVDGEDRDLGDQRFLLSPQDLASHDEIPALMALGVTSFKIEGRLKSPEYVAAVTGVYRKAIDAALRDAGAGAIGKDDKYSLEMTFSRGLYSGWMHGVNHQELVPARYGKKRGAFVGRIAMLGIDWIELDGDSDVKPGMAWYSILEGTPMTSKGGRVYSVSERRIYFQRDHIKFDLLREGDRLWKTDDPQLNRELRKTWQGREPEGKKSPLSLTVSGNVGEPLRVLDCATGLEATSELHLQEAKSRPLNDEILMKQLGRLGNTSYLLKSIDNRLSSEVMLPVSELNHVRRRLVEMLDAQEVPVSQAAEKSEWRDLLPTGADAVPDESVKLSVLCRSQAQLEAVVGLEVDTIHLEFEDVRRYRDAVAFFRESGSQAKLLLATPRIQKPGEDGFFKLIERAEPDGVLLRNLGGLGYFASSDLIRVGDFALNVANPISASLLMEEGLKWLTVSYDLNISQVLELAQAVPSEWLELTLHQHIPMFHMEHCVFCAFMSKGTDYTNCGRPCEEHTVQLRDRVGMLHPLAADVGCRNTLYQGKAQTGAAYFLALRDSGVRRFRVELLTEDGAGAKRVINAYRDLISGALSGAQLRRELKADTRLGVTEGPLAV